MIFKQIWERYLAKEFLKVFTLFLAGFYFIYVVIDYSAHMQDFINGKSIVFSKICLYYFFQFFKRVDLLLPLALLIATIKVLLGFNMNFELLAFQSTGFKIRTLTRPFLIIASICTLFNLFAQEFILPQSLNYIDKFYDAHLRHSYRGNRKEPLHIMHLNDQSKLVYQFYDASKESFFDVIWVRSPTDIWRMKYLKADPENPVGQYVDHLERTREGIFEKTETFNSHLIKELKWQSDLPRKGFIPFENRSLSDLFSQMVNSRNAGYESAEIRTQFYFKVLMPFLCMLVTIAAPAYCVRFSRNLSPFLIYALALFSYITFFTFMDAAVILGENAALSPFLIIFSPFLLAFGFFGWKYLKLD